jgi:hypothetical protein
MNRNTKVDRAVGGFCSELIAGIAIHHPEKTRAVQGERSTFERATTPMKLGSKCMIFYKHFAHLPIVVYEHPA